MTTEREDVRLCAICGKPFDPRNRLSGKQTDKMYCSYACAQTAAHRQWVQRQAREKRERAECTEAFRVDGPLWRKCPICGKSFDAKGEALPSESQWRRKFLKKYCSAQCAAQANTWQASARARYKRALARGIKEEIEVAARILDFYRSQYVCDPVLLGLSAEMLAPVPKTSAKKKPGRKRKDSGEMGGTRRCHSCGRPTSNYRCPECLKKWRKKHGVEACDIDGEGYYDE